MATFGDLQTQVASDLRRSNVSGDIALAITDSIRDHSSERFWFNETRTYAGIALTSAADEYPIVAVPPVQDFIKIDWVRVLIGGLYIRMRRIGAEELEEYALAGTTGPPYWWDYYANVIRFYPKPNTTYSSRIAGHYRLPDLVNAADSNNWTNEAKSLIRYSALKRIYAYPVRDQAQAQMAEQAELRELEYLRRETERRKRRGRMQAYY